MVCPDFLPDKSRKGPALGHMRSRAKRLVIHWPVSRLVGWLVAIPFLAALGTTHAQDATWDTNPGSSDWNTNTNWTPQAVPTGTATFGLSSQTSITFSGPPTSVGTIQFNPGALAYSLVISHNFELTGLGIVNNSSNVPTFAVVGGIVFFRNMSSAGNATITNNFFGVMQFFNTSTAGNATITTNNGGVTLFNNASTGGNARFITDAGGLFDISSLFSGGITAGSIEGAGTYSLGSKSLTVGGNNLSTEVSGTIADGGFNGGTGGSLVKVALEHLFFQEQTATAAVQRSRPAC
jgi:hypothetical protein